MSLNIRRVVTGHDDQGRAKVLIDETVKNVASQRPGAHYSVIWSTEGFPVNNDGDDDPSGKKIGTTIANGTVFRVVSFGPGVAPAQPPHRFDRLCGGHVGRDRHGARRRQRPPQGRRRAGAARHHPQLGEQGHRSLA